jgi:hypothetical protein
MPPIPPYPKVEDELDKPPIISNAPETPKQPGTKDQLPQIEFDNGQQPSVREPLPKPAEKKPEKVAVPATPIPPATQAPPSPQQEPAEPEKELIPELQAQLPEISMKNEAEQEQVKHTPESAPLPQSQPEGRARRLYLVNRTTTKDDALTSPHPGEKTDDTIKEIKVTAAPEVAEQEGFDTMVKEVYSQLKANPTNAGAKILSVPPTSNTTGQNDQPPAPSSLFGTTNNQARPPVGSLNQGDAKPPQIPSTAQPAGGDQALERDLFKELNKVSGNPPNKPSARTEQVKFVEIPREKGMGCPNCREQTTRVVFCPYCGSGMCANCSPNIRPEGDFFIYTCPRCGEEINVSKK